MLLIRDYADGKIIKGFDSAIRITETTELTNEIVGQPLETGEQVIDHIIVNPDIFSWELHVSNTAINLEDVDEKGNYKLETGAISRNIFSLLRKLRSDRKLLILETENETLKPVAVKSVNIVNSAPYNGTLNIKVDFQEIQAVKLTDPKDLEKATEIKKYQQAQSIIKEEVVTEKELKWGEQKLQELRSMATNDWQWVIKANNALNNISGVFDTVKSTVQGISNNAGSVLRIASNFNDTVKSFANMGYAVRSGVKELIDESLTILNDGVDLVGSAISMPTSIELDFDTLSLQLNLTYDKFANCWKADCSSVSENDKGELTSSSLFINRAVVTNSNLFEGVTVDGLESMFVLLPQNQPVNNEGEGLDSSLLGFTDNKCSLAIIRDKKTLEAWDFLNLYGGTTAEPPNISVEEMDYQIKVM